MRRRVYNLEFRWKCRQITLLGYRFYRVDEYEDRLRALQHLTSSVGEYQIRAHTGGHAHTAYVDCPAPEPAAVLAWDNKDVSALADILLLLSLFTTRSVLVDADDGATDNTPFITADPRIFPWGGVLATSIPYVPSHPEDEANDLALYKIYDKGLEIHLNEVYRHIRDQNWLDLYRRGHFLLLFQWAIQQRTVNAAFIHCWTIWEHLFAILNDNWMSKNHIRKCPAVEKIAFMIVKYAVKERLSEKDKSRLHALANIRNRLIHYGAFPEEGIHSSNAVMFIRMTEFIVARILGLQPSNIFGTVEKFEEFLDSRQAGGRS